MRNEYIERDFGNISSKDDSSVNDEEIKVPEPSKLIQVAFTIFLSNQFLNYCFYFLNMNMYVCKTQ